MVLPLITGIAGSARDSMSDHPIKVGDSVRIVSGPFAGGYGSVQAVDGDKVRVEMLVLGQPAPFTVRLSQVTALAAGTSAH